MTPNQNDVVVNVGTNSRAAQTDIQRLERSIQKLDQATQNTKDFKALAQSAKTAKTATDATNASATSLAGTMGTLTGLAVSFTAAIGAMLTLNAYHKIADDATRLQNRLRLVHSSQLDVINAHEKLYKIARATRGQLDGMGDLYYRMSGAAKATGRSQQDVFKAVTAIQLATRISNAPAESAAAAIVQLNQAMASGVLRGEEFNSITEQLPRMAEAIASYMGTNIGGLRKMAEDGLITSEIVFSAMLSQSSVMQNEFSKLKVTAAEGFGQMTLAGGKFVSEIEDTFHLAGSMASRLLLVADAFDTITPTIKTAVFEVKSLLDSAYLDIMAGKGIGDISPENLLKLQGGLRRMRQGESPIEAKPEETSLFDSATSAFNTVASAGERVQDVVGNIKKGFIVAFYAGKSLVSVVESMSILVPKVFGPAFTMAEHLEVAMARASTQLEVFTRAQRGALVNWTNQKIEAMSFFQFFDTRIERGFRDLFRAGSMGDAVAAARDISEALDSQRGGTFGLIVRDAEESMAAFGEEIRTGLVYLDLAERRVFAINNVRFDRLAYSLGIVFSILRDLYNLTIGKTITLLGAELEILAFRVFLIGSALVGFRHDFTSFGDMVGGISEAVAPMASSISDGLSSATDAVRGFSGDMLEAFSDTADVVRSKISEVAELPSKLASRLEQSLGDISDSLNSESLAERLNNWITGDGGIDSVIKQISMAGIGAAIFRMNIPLALTFSVLTMSSVRSLLVPILTDLEEAIASSDFGIAFGKGIDALGVAIAGMASKAQKAVLWLVQMLDQVGISAGSKLASAGDVVSEFAHLVERAFFWVYDRVVGHSWWPDLIDGVVDHASRLGSSAMKYVSDFTKSVDGAFKSLADKTGFSFFDNWMRVGEDDELMRKQLLVRYAAIALTVAGLPAIGIPMAFVSTDSGRDVMSAFLDEYEHFFTMEFGDPFSKMVSSARILRRELTDTTFIDASMDYVKYKASIVGNLLNMMGAKFSMFGGSVSNMSTLDVIKSKVDGIKEAFSAIVAHVELSVDAQAMLGHLGRVLMAGVSILFGPIWLKALSAMSLQDYVESYVALPLVDSFEYIFGTHLPSLIAEFVGSTLGSIGASIVNTLPATVAHIFEALPSLSESFFGQFGGIVSMFGSLLSIVLSTVGTIFGIIPGTGLLAALLFGHVGYKTFTAKDKLDGFKEAIFGAAATGKAAARPGLKQMLFPQMLDGAVGALRFNSALMKLAAGVGILSPLLISSVSALDGFAAAAAIASLSILGGGGVTGQLTILGNAVQGFGAKLTAMTGIGSSSRLKTMFRQIANMGNMAAQAFESNRGAMNTGAMSAASAFSVYTARTPSAAGNMSSSQSIAGPMAAQFASVKALAASMVTDIKTKVMAAFTAISTFLISTVGSITTAINAIKATMLGAFLFKAAIATLVVLLLSLSTSANAATSGLNMTERAGVSLAAAIGMISAAVVGTAGIAAFGDFRNLEKASQTATTFKSLFMGHMNSIAAAAKMALFTIPSKAISWLAAASSPVLAMLPLGFRKAGVAAVLYTAQLVSAAKAMTLLSARAALFGSVATMMGGAGLTGVFTSAILRNAKSFFSLFAGGLKNIFSIGSSIVLFFTKLGLVLSSLTFAAAGLIGIAIFGKGDNIFEKIKNLGSALKEAIFPAAKSWKEAVPDRNFGGLKFQFANRIDGMDSNSMSTAEKAHFERVNTRVAEVMNQTQEFYDLQGYLTQEQVEAAERAYAEWQRVSNLSGKKEAGVGGLARLVAEAEATPFIGWATRIGRVWKPLTEGLMTAFSAIVTALAWVAKVILVPFVFAYETVAGLAEVMAGLLTFDMSTAESGVRRIADVFSVIGDMFSDSNQFSSIEGTASAISSSAAWLGEAISSTASYLKDTLVSGIAAIGATVENIGGFMWDTLVMFGDVISKLLQLDLFGALWVIADYLVAGFLRVWSVFTHVFVFLNNLFRPIDSLLGVIAGALPDWVSSPGTWIKKVFAEIWDAIGEGLGLGWKVLRKKDLTHEEALRWNDKTGSNIVGKDPNALPESNARDQLMLFENLRPFATDSDVKLIEDATMAYTDAYKAWANTSANEFDVDSEELKQLGETAEKTKKNLLELLYEVNQRAAVNEGISTYTTEIEGFLKRMSATGGDKMTISQLLFGGEEREFVDSFVSQIEDASAQLKTILGSNDATAVPIRVQVAGLTKTRNDLAKLFNEVAFFDGEIDLAVSLSGWELSKSQMEDLFVSNESAYAQAVSLTNKLARLKAQKAGMGATASRDERVKIISDIRAVEAELLKLKPVGVAIAAVMKEALSDIKADNFSIGAVDLDTFVEVQRISEELKKARDELKKFEEGQRDVNKLNGKLTTAEYQAEWNRLNNSVSNFRQQLSMIAIPDSKFVADNLGSVSDGPAEKARMMSESMQAQAKQDAMAVRALQDTIGQLESKGATMTPFDRDAVRAYQSQIQKLQGSYKKVFEAPKKEKKEKKEKEYKNIFERFSEHFKKNGNIDIKLEDFGLINSSVQQKIRDLAAMAQKEFNKLDQKEGYMPINPEAFREALRKFNEFKDEIEDRMKKANFDSFWESISANSGIELEVAIDKDLFGVMSKAETKLASIARRRKAIAPESDGTFSAASLAKLRALAAEEKAVVEERAKLARDNQTVAKQLETVMSAMGVNIDQVATEADANKLLGFYMEISDLQRALAAGDLTPESWIAKQKQLKDAVEKASIALDGELTYLAKLAGMELSTDLFDSSEASEYIKLIREAGAEFKDFQEAKKRVLNGNGSADDKKLIANEAARRRREAMLTKRAELSRNASSMRSTLGISDEALTRLRNSDIRSIIAGRNRLAEIEEKLFSVGTDNLGVMKEHLRESLLINEAEAKLVAAAERYKEVRDSMTSSMSGALSTALSGEDGKHLTSFLTSTAKTVIDDFSTRVAEAWLKPISEGFGTMLTKHGASFSQMLDKAPAWISSMTSMGIDRLFGAGSSKAVGNAVSGATSFIGDAIGSAVDGVFGEGTASSWISGLFGGSEDDAGGAMPGVPDGSKNNPLWVQIKDKSFNNVPNVPDFDMFGAIVGAGIKLAGNYFGGAGVGAESGFGLGSTDAGMVGFNYDSAGMAQAGEIGATYGAASLNIEDYLAGAFDTGGVVPGQIGSAQLALVHGGETILPTHKKSIQELSLAKASGPQQSVFNINVTGDVSRQTRRTIVEMLPSIASGVNSVNQESGKK